MAPPAAEPMRTLYLGAHTLARMRPRQLAGIAERTARELVVPALPVDVDRRYERRVPADPAARTDPLAANTDLRRDATPAATRRRHRTGARAAAAGTPAFLNRTARVTTDGTVDWDADRLAALPLQWRLKLYGFEPLADALYGFPPDGVPEAVRRSLDGWCRDWLDADVDAVGIGRGRYLRGAWTPWAVSLRIVRWLRYLAWRRRDGPDEASFDRAIRREIYRNALFLERHVEWDVDGNHLVENGTGLLAAGLAFDVGGWTETGTSILTTAAREQFLDDGCHYERSPMYHAAVLTRYLTAVDLLSRYGRPVPGRLETTAADAADFLAYLRPPDGEIPLLNDAVHGEAPPLESCLRYARAVGLAPTPPASGTTAALTADGAGDTRRAAHREPTEGDGTGDDGCTRSDPPGHAGTVGESGYCWLRTDAGSMLVDGGPVGPPHLPGHSHSDTLGVLLWIDGRQVVTDTGTYGYTAGPRRNYARGVRSHNTVQLGDAEPIPLGGRYLMGPRPEPRSRVRRRCSVTLFEGRYDARPLAAAPYTHHRALYAGDDWWLIDDTVTAVASRRDGPPVEDGGTVSRLHLHPDVDHRHEDGTVRLRTGADRPIRIHPLDGATVSTARRPYFPRFGHAVDRTVVEIRPAAGDPGRVGVAVTVGDPPGDVSLETDADGSRRIRLGDGEHPLPATRLERDR